MAPAAARHQQRMLTWLLWPCQVLWKLWTLHRQGTTSWGPPGSQQEPRGCESPPVTSPISVSGWEQDSPPWGAVGIALSATLADWPCKGSRNLSLTWRQTRSGCLELRSNKALLVLFIILGAFLRCRWSLPSRAQQADAAQLSSAVWACTWEAPRLPAGRA